MVSIHDVLDGAVLGTKWLHQNESGVYRIGHDMYDFGTSDTWNMGAKRRISTNFEAMRIDSLSAPPSDKRWMDGDDF